MVEGLWKGQKEQQEQKARAPWETLSCSAGLQWTLCGFLLFKGGRDLVWVFIF